MFKFIKNLFKKPTQISNIRPFVKEIVDDFTANKSLIQEHQSEFATGYRVHGKHFEIVCSNKGVFWWMFFSNSRDYQQITLTCDEHNLLQSLSDDIIKWVEYNKETAKMKNQVDLLESAFPHLPKESFKL